MANSKTKRLILRFAAVLALTIFATAALACGSTPEAANPGSGSGSSSQEGSSFNAVPETEAPQTGASLNFANLKGDITIDGSSTVYPISEAVAEEFGLLTGGNVRITVGLSGSGGGFKKFCNGESDITSASRPIKQKEVDACLASGVEYVEVPVAIDGLSVMVHPDNDFIDCMTIAELHTLWGPDAEGVITKWSQVRTGWPAEDIRLYGPGVDSGTFDYFTEVVNDEAASSRGDYTASEDDNVLVQGIGGGRNSLGFFGYAYYVENTDKLKLVGIDGGSGCVTPSNETIEDGSYQPLARPMFIYIREDALAKPHLTAYARFHLSEAGGQALVRDVGYLPYPNSVYELAQERLDRRLTGTLFGGDNAQKGAVATVLSENR